MIVATKAVVPLFDQEWYLDEYPDVVQAGIDPVQHFLEFGAREGRNPNPLFDTAFYRQQCGENVGLAIEHYVAAGAAAGLQPNPLFDPIWYLECNPDVREAGIDPLAHYLSAGAAEGRDPHPLFDTSWYVEQNPAAAEMNPLAHYLRWGAKSGVSPHPLFDAAWYSPQTANFDTAQSSPLEHYLQVGARSGVDPHPLFASAWYRSNDPELERSALSPLEHYVRWGAAEGRDPHPLFCARWYLEQNEDVAEAGVNPLIHFIRDGERELRPPHPLFDPKFYVEQQDGSEVARTQPLRHYLSVGWKRGAWPNRAFDPTFYLRAYPSARDAGVEPLTDYVLRGRAESRVTSAADVSFELLHPSTTVPREPVAMSPVTKSDIRAIAFYLPQFHRTAENDAWWGEGFTEWRNVRRGTPQFRGHHQPHVPSTLGYYDLTDETVLYRQAELARAHGIEGFCFYYYWFAGRVLLDLPLQHMQRRDAKTFPFCICWANENWTRRWDGRDDEILIAQEHSAADDLAFIASLEPFLTSTAYIRVERKPLLLVYRPSLLPDPRATIGRWRDYFRTRGLGELHIGMVKSFSEAAVDPTIFDAAVQFPPHAESKPVTPLIGDVDEQFRGHIYDYIHLRQTFLDEARRAADNERFYPAVMPSWDNTARRGSRATLWVNSAPEFYQEWLAEAAALLRQRPNRDRRIVFINAWNEWAEGCHLEPDERYEFAWLNATALALKDPNQEPHAAAPPAEVARPDPPQNQSPQLAALRGVVRLAISVLLFHREDILETFLQRLLRQIARTFESPELEADLYLSFNYEPTAAAIELINAAITTLPRDRRERVHVIKNGFNLGFGRGHDAILARASADVFITLNSDLAITAEDWLQHIAERFRKSDAAIVGLVANASYLREDGCGIPIANKDQSFDFVDGSVLAIRAEVAKQFGLFSPAFDYFYFEDVDLCLRYRQMGFRIELLEIDYQHDRGASSRLLPRYAIENVLDRNRARFFARWGKYLKERALPNRLGIRFPTADHNVQCASLPAIFGLLAEHPTAVLDIWGVHERLQPLFRHKRIRLIPAWQVLSQDDYLRYYEIEDKPTREHPLAYEIAEALSVEPLFDAVRSHLEALASNKRAKRKSGSAAVLYIQRTNPLFDGLAPAPESFGAIEDWLQANGFTIEVLSEYAQFELSAVGSSWQQAGSIEMIDLLRSILDADLLVATDHWIAQLVQLVNTRAFLWLGPTTIPRTLWNVEQAAAFADAELDCLGCHHRFGDIARNVCLRGDVACMREAISDSFTEALGRFVAGERLAAAAIVNDRAVHSGRTASTQLSLAAFPRSVARSVLVLTPTNPKLSADVVEHARSLAEAAIEGMRGCRIVYDSEGEAPLRGVPHAHRQEGMAALRQKAIERHLRDEQWVFWVDADIVWYDPELIAELIARAEGGIAAPLVLMEGSAREPARADGFGPGRFYDLAGFVEHGRWARFTPPYFDQLGPVYELESVGSCYLVNADLYRHGARHEQDRASRALLARGGEWPADVIAQNQRGPANSFTEHYSVCEFARKAGLPVRAFSDLIAYHQRG